MPRTNRTMHVATFALMLASIAGSALASSHREAPFITESPKVDATDFYMFNSYEKGREGYVTIIANYQPFQTQYGGPNFFQMDPNALYQINLDNNGDGKEDISFSFQFKNKLDNIALNIGGKMVPIPLYNAGAIGLARPNDPNLNIEESYTLDVVYGDQFRGHSVPVRGVGGEKSFKKPADFVGQKSFPQGYEKYARSFIQDVYLPGCEKTARVFVGQRKDPFVVNLGEVFDLVNLNPLGPVNGKADSLADDNCTSIIIEVPASFLRGPGNKETVIGGWTSAALPRARVLRNNPSFDRPEIETGPWLQVSRLGMPLVNEVVIGLPDKNKFNESRPREDGQFATYVTNPTLPAIIESIFSVKAPTLPRNDLVTVFLTGVPGLNQPAGVQASEMLRLETNTVRVPVRPKGKQSELGVLGGDLAGFPNGRRPGDDVVDIELRVVVGALYPDAGVAGGNAPGGKLPLTDGAFVNDQNYDEVFPYLRTPVTSSPQKP
jgi:hypothetical protein